MSVEQTESVEARLSAMQAELAEVTERIETVVAVNEQLLGECEELRDRLQQRDTEAQALIAETAALKQSRDETVAQLALLSQAWRLLEQRLRKLEGVRGVRPAAAPAPAAAALPAAVAAPMPAALAVSAITTAVPTETVDAGGTIQIIVHVEADPQLRQAVRKMADKWSFRYADPDAPVTSETVFRRVLAVNIALPDGDPMDAITNAPRWGIPTPTAFAYCTNGAHGFVLGMVEFFPPPFDADTCVARLLTGRSKRRILVVSEDFEATNPLRELLTRIECPTSIAFDARQALDLVSMIKPDIVVIDLTLPKGDGLRLAGRLRASTQTTNIPLAFFWRTPINVAEFRLNTQRLIRDFPFQTDMLSRGIGRTLGNTR